MPDQKPFRLAIIGAGMVVSELHMPAAMTSELVAITAIVDPVTDRARALAREFGIGARTAARIEDIEDPIDGAIIASPNNTHRDIAVACAARGIHCLIEKPLATTVAEAEDICRVAEEKNVVVAVGYSTRFRNEVILLKNLLDRGYFGAVRQFHFQEGTIGGWSPASAYNLDKSAAGGGVLTVVGTHFIDRMLYWFGYPDETAMFDDAVNGPEAHCMINVAFHRGASRIEGTINLSKTFPLKPGLVLDTERGRVVLGLGASPLILRPHDSPDVELVIAPRGAPIFPRHVDNFQLQLEDFVAAARGERAPLVGARQGLLSIRLLNELYAKRKPLPQDWNEPMVERARGAAQ